MMEWWIDAWENWILDVGRELDRLFVAWL